MYPCTCALVITGQHVTQAVCIFKLRLSARSFSILVCDAASPTIWFTPALWCGWYLLIIGFFLLYKVRISTPWSFEKILRSLFRTWVYHFYFLLTTFPLKDPKLLEKLIALSAQDGLEVLSRPFLFLVLWHRVFQILQMCCPFGGLCGFYVRKGDPKFSEWLCRDCEKSPENSSLLLLLSLFCDVEGLMESLPISLEGFLV